MKIKPWHLPQVTTGWTARLAGRFVAGFAVAFAAFYAILLGVQWLLS